MTLFPRDHIATGGCTKRKNNKGEGVSENSCYLVFLIAFVHFGCCINFGSTESFLLWLLIIYIFLSHIFWLPPFLFNIAPPELMLF